MESLLLTKEDDEVVNVSNKGVKGFGRDIFYDVLLIAGGLVRDQPLKYILLFAQLS